MLIDPFGAALDQAMQAKGLNADQVAMGTGIPVGHVRAYLAGHLRPANRDRADRLETFLDLKPGTLTSLQPPMKSYKRPF
jgi:hypothetical protein